MLIAPSLLSADFTDLGKELDELYEAGADMVHMDIMDGHFVPNITFGPDQLLQMREKSKLNFDVHLMIENPDSYIKRFAQSSEIITVHQEACTHLHRVIDMIKKEGRKAGVSINPATPVSMLEEIIPYCDLILIMSVNPGFGGQKFIDSSVKKIEFLVNNFDIEGKMIEVDGGIDLLTAPLVLSAGANVLVSGSYIFRGNKKENIDALRSVDY